MRVGDALKALERRENLARVEFAHRLGEEGAKDHVAGEMHGLDVDIDGELAVAGGQASNRRRNASLASRISPNTSRTRAF